MMVFIGTHIDCATFVKPRIAHRIDIDFRQVRCCAGGKISVMAGIDDRTGLLQPVISSSGFEEAGVGISVDISVGISCGKPLYQAMRHGHRATCIAIHAVAVAMHDAVTDAYHRVVIVHIHCLSGRIACG